MPKIVDATQYKEEEELDHFEDEYMKRYKFLKNDAKILQSLKDKFISEIADVVLIFCNKLSEREQEIVYELIKDHKDTCNERMKEAQRTLKPARQTHLYVVHNYRMLKEIDEVRKQIEKDLEKNFNAIECSLFTSDEEKYKTCNSTMFQDQFGVGHLILAAHGSEAGEYYNPSTFGFFKKKLRVIESRTSANVKKLFLDFCNKNIPKMLKQEEFKVKFDTDQSAIIKDGASKTVLGNLRYDELGYFEVSSAFKPKYSMVEKTLDNGTIELKIEVELLDTEYQSKLLKDGEGQWCLVIRGEKKVPVSTDAKSKEKMTENNREHGPFKLVVRLPRGEKIDFKRTEKAKGIVEYIVNFSESLEETLD